MRAPDFSAILWKITARNHLGWPTERRHRLTGRYQHIRYYRSSQWQDGRFSYEGGPFGGASR